MFGAKQERILALDGALIHFFPPENKAIFDKGKSVILFLKLFSYSYI